MITTFLLQLAKRLNEYKAQMGLTYFREFSVTSTVGPKYTKVFRCEISHDGKQGPPCIVAFIDAATGDIFKPATYKAPAKHARGNINSQFNGMEAIGTAGNVNYMR